MDMENFISYVLMAQMDESEPEELLKAKSVIIRTYILYKMKDKNSNSSFRFGKWNIEIMGS